MPGDGLNLTPSTSSQQVEPRTGTTTDYTHDNDAMFPFKPDPTVEATYTYAPRESVMSNKEVAKKWDTMFKIWKVTDNTTKTLLVNNVLVYFVLNGSSPRSRFNGYFTANGKDYSVRVIREVLGDDVRRFARAHADRTRNILRENESLANTQAVRFNFSTAYGHLAFDCADYCSGLTQPELALVERAKTRVIRSANDYDEGSVGLATDSPSSGRRPLGGDKDDL